MKPAAFHWRRAANAVLLGAILFLTILPYFGWAWHRVLPEHTHIFFGAPHEAAGDEILPAPSSPAAEPDLVLNTSGTQIGSGIVHLPGFMGAQILSLAVNLAALLWMRMPPELATHVAFSPLFYQSPLFFPLDPPPTY